MSTIFVITAIGAMAAGFVQGLSGFAYSMVAVSFWAWVLEPRLVATLAVFGSLFGQLTATFTTSQQVHLTQLLPFVLGGLLGIPLGVWVLPNLDQLWFKMGLGLLFVIWCPLMLCSGRLPHIQSGRVANGIIGMCGGILSGLGGFSGSIPALWCTLCGYDKSTQRGIIQNFNLTMLSVTFVVYISTGLVTLAMLPYFFTVAIAMLLPTLFGHKLYVGLNDYQFKLLILSLLTCSGIALLSSTIPAFLTR